MKSAPFAPGLAATFLAVLLSTFAAVGLPPAQAQAPRQVLVLPFDMNAAEDLTFLHGEVDAVDGHEIAEAAHEARCLDGCGHGASREGDRRAVNSRRLGARVARSKPVVQRLGVLPVQLEAIRTVGVAYCLESGGSDRFGAVRRSARLDRRLPAFGRNQFSVLA